MSDDLRPGLDGRPRCGWGTSTPEYEAYHDEEWGRPIRDADALFERLSLEAFQSGLSWLTILRKREGYRAAFADFDPEKIAKFTARDVTRLMRDPGIVRNQQKIRSAIGNARAFLKMQEEFGSFDAWIWEYVGGKPLLGKARGRGDILYRLEVEMPRDLNHDQRVALEAFAETINDHNPRERLLRDASAGAAKVS